MQVMYGVAVLEGLRRSATIGFRPDDIQRVITIGQSPTPLDDSSVDTRSDPGLGRGVDQTAVAGEGLRPAFATGARPAFDPAVAVALPRPRPPPSTRRPLQA